MQIAKSFDKVTLKKMGISALILLGGTLLDFIANNILILITGFGVPIEYRPVTVSVCAWLVNTAKEWLKGQESDTIQE